MINAFIISELLLYILPPVIIYLLLNRFQYIFTYFKNWPLNLSLLLIPLWLTLIHCFSILIFTYSLLPLAIFLTIFVLFIHLYQYIRLIQVFHFKKYYPLASRLAFLCFSSFLLSLVILRIFTYFII